MDDIFTLNVFAHEDGLFLYFSLGVGELDVIPGVDLGDVFGDLDVIFLEHLVWDQVQVYHEDDNIGGELWEHVVELGDRLPLDHADSLVVDSLVGELLFLNVNGTS